MTCIRLTNMSNNIKRNATFGFLTIIRRDWSRVVKNKSFYICRCRCNNMVSVRSDHRGKSTVSCGCYAKELALKAKEGNINQVFKTIKHSLLYYQYIRPIHDHIKKRDGYSCVLCGKTTDLHIHHILKKSRYPDYIIEPNNLVVLCQECHILDAHDGNTNKINLKVSAELLSIVFQNSNDYIIPEELIYSVKEKVKDFITSNN